MKTRRKTPSPGLYRRGVAGFVSDQRKRRRPNERSPARPCGVACAGRGTISRAISRPSTNRYRRRRANSSAPPRAWTILRNPSRHAGAAFLPAAEIVAAAESRHAIPARAGDGKQKAGKRLYPAGQRLSDALDQAKQKNAALESQVAAATRQYEQYARTLGESDSATIAAKLIWTRCRRNTRSPSAEVKKLEGPARRQRQGAAKQCGRCDKGADEPQQRAGRAQGRPEAQIKSATERLARMESAWTKAGRFARRVWQRNALPSADAMNRTGKGPDRSAHDAGAGAGAQRRSNPPWTLNPRSPRCAQNCGRDRGGV